MTLSRTAWRLLIVLALALVAVAARPTGAAAHDAESSYLYLDIAEGGSLGGRVEVPYPVLREVFDLALDGSSEDVIAELEAELDSLHAFLADHTAIGADGDEWAITFEGVELFEDARYAVFPFDVAMPLPEVPQVLDFTFDPFLDEFPDRSNLVLLGTDLLRGVIDQEANILVAVDANTRSVSADLGNTSQWKNFRGNIGIGVDHIRTGPDHILFILVLLLPSVLVLQTVWRPAPSFGTALWRVLKVVSMFTVAHSVTFTLAGLDVLPLPPSQLIEIIIALSIAAAAVHNLKPVLENREWILAFAFGLFHGMGFAGLVDALDVSRTTQLVSLLGRNVGIEIGQVIIVLVAFPALFLLSRTRFYRAFFIASSLVLSGISLAWAFERLVTVDVGLTPLIISIVRWPRSLIVTAVLTALIAGLYARERQTGRLVETAEAAA